ncbi:MAG: isoprenyl transferase [Planctomycetota bacterium]|jgi:undecaprenyl diphosphate synthase
MPASAPNTIEQTAELLGIEPHQVPQSIAIIMDGNGRWAAERGLPRSAGHEEGARNVRRIATESAQLGLKALTLYSFSIENWKRPKDEIEVLMHLYAEYLRRERPTMMENNLRLRHLGRRDGLPQPVLDELDTTIDATSSNDGMFLCLALNYGSRAEIVDAVRRIAARVAGNDLDPQDIDEGLVAESLDTADVPDPDLLIRTSGEMRLSNFLLWQLSYAEFVVTDAYWPDFGVELLHEALRAYSQRDRRFGALSDEKA